jgi:hypothetical protein
MIFKLVGLETAALCAPGSVVHWTARATAMAGFLKDSDN